MELYPLQGLSDGATEKELLARGGEAAAHAARRLAGAAAAGAELGEKLIDRSGKDLILTDAGRIVLDYARRFEKPAPAGAGELAGRTARQFGGHADRRRQRIHSLYLLRHIERYRGCIPR
jgi:hypothetical protein